ncbi:MAG: ROK family protein, partial [Anaerolineae bacterium]
PGYPIGRSVRREAEMTVFISYPCITDKESGQVKDNVVAVDLGGTHIRSALINEKGEILARAERETLAQEGPEAVIGRIEASIRDVARGTEAISIVAPGPLNPRKGIIHQAPNLPGWREVPLADILHRTFEVPVHLNNDANLAALGEHRFGAGQGVNDLIYLTISTGIGGGIISQGRLLVGAKGLAGEVGHMTLEPEGPPCGCGGRGHLEALASGTAIARRAVEEIEKGAESRIESLVKGDLEKVTAQVVTRAAKEGDALAISIFEEAGFYIGLGVTNLLHILNPELIIIGGGVSKAGDLLFEPIRATVEARAIPSIKEGVRIVPSALRDDVGLLGAAAFVLKTG